MVQLENGIPYSTKSVATYLDQRYNTSYTSPCNNNNDNDNDIVSNNNNNVDNNNNNDNVDNNNRDVSFPAFAGIPAFMKSKFPHFYFFSARFGGF